MEKKEIWVEVVEENGIYSIGNTLDIHSDDGQICYTRGGFEDLLSLMRWTYRVAGAFFGKDFLFGVNIDFVFYREKYGQTEVFKEFESVPSERWSNIRDYFFDKPIWEKYDADILKTI